MRVLSTACDSASITSFVSKWVPFSFIFNPGNGEVGWMGDDGQIVFGHKFHGEKDRALS
jgi:hypothetical protein